jgi:hypothetical protein
MNSVGARGADSGETRLPTRIITCAWGEKYLNELLSIVVPSLLASGNLPFVASQVPTELVILTEEKYFTRVSGDPRIARIRKFCPIRLIGVDDLVSNPHVYGKSLTYALHRGLADLGAEMVNIFLNSDFVLAEGSLQNVLPRLIRGSRIVAAPSYCVVAEDVKPIIETRIDLTDGTLSIPFREMARLALDYRHNTVRANTVNDRRFHTRYVTQFYWEVDEDTLVGHQMPVAIIAMRPERYVREPNSYWDQGLMKELCPESRVDIIGDSDEFLMIELREREVAKDTMLPGPGEPSVLARDMLGMRTLYQLDFAFRPLTLHAEDLPPTLEDARRPRLKAERDFYSNQTVELQTHNQVLTETATQYALRVQELERELLAARTEIAANDYPRLKAERDFYSNRMVELQTHNQVLTETATKFARRLQGHLEVKEGLPALPSILFTSIPKSGTVFTGQMLSRGLGLELVRLTAGSFPRYLFDLPRLVQFSAGGMIATEHFDASPENLQLLEAFVDRWVVHIRDPRSVLLSWVHNLDRLHRERHNAPHHLLYVCPTPPKHYFGLSLSQKVDWNIEHFLPNVLGWTKTWVETHDAGHHNILLTTFSDILSSEDEFLFRILDFYEISRDRFSRPVVESNDDLHFRVGREDEWRDWFTPMQLAQIRVMIDGPLTERFGWPLA